MFDQLLAIDVANRIPCFEQVINKYTKKPLIKLETPVLSADSLSADALLISIYQQLGVSELSLLKNLGHIFVLGSSTAKIDMAYCHKHHIKVHTVKDYCDHETAEWVMWQIFNHFRGQKGQSILNKSLGLIGVGSVGSIVLKSALAFNMKVFFYARGEYPELIAQGAIKKMPDELFRKCDVISLHTPAHIQCLDQSTLFHAKENLLLINTCLGEVIKESELFSLLAKRPDISIIMDGVAGKNYSGLSERTIVLKEPAYLTLESKERLINKFLGNIERVQTILFS